MLNRLLRRESEQNKIERIKKLIKNGQHIPIKNAQLAKNKGLLITESEQNRIERIKKLIKNDEPIPNKNNQFVKNKGLKLNCANATKLYNNYQRNIRNKNTLTSNNINEIKRTLRLKKEKCSNNSSSVPPSVPPRIPHSRGSHNNSSRGLPPPIPPRRPPPVPPRRPPQEGGTKKLKLSQTKSKHKIHKGPRGGKYYIKNGKKHYVK